MIDQFGRTIQYLRVSITDKVASTTTTRDLVFEVR